MLGAALEVTKGYQPPLRLRVSLATLHFNRPITARTESGAYTVRCSQTLKIRSGGDAALPL